MQGDAMLLPVKMEGVHEQSLEAGTDEKGIFQKYRHADIWISVQSYPVTLLTYRTMREEIFVVLSHQCYGDLV